jgi:import inner membrane translocase subunit TIM50
MLKLVNSKWVKDISILNRDLRRVLVVDKDSEGFSMYPDNGIVIPEWNGDENDRALFDTIAFIDHLHSHDVKDIRKEIQI